MGVVCCVEVLVSSVVVSVFLLPQAISRLSVAVVTRRRNNLLAFIA